MYGNGGIDACSAHFFFLQELINVFYLNYYPSFC